MVTWQQLEQFVKETIRPLKGRKHEQAAFAIAALCFSGGLWLGEKRFPDFSQPLDWKAIFQIALYAAGAISFVYGAIRVWRLVHPPELPPAKDRPSAIKGPMAFTEADGELFRKLGRESELQKLLGLALDDQVLMIVVRGASGAGKTSLLRAGLKHILGDRVTFHYWEAVPTEPDKGLLRAIQEKWPEGAGRPVSLEELVNPADTLGRQSHVIVLDQFEQLRGSRKIFSLLRRIARESRPPHRITWVIAFRREFSADWMDIVSPEQERGFRPPQDVSLRLFTPDQAREVIGQLVNESNLKDSIEQSVINNLVEAATVESEVSPVDIGIGLLVLAELHERQNGQTITIRDYQFAGGAEGLLTQYISRCLDLFPKESQEAILKAMLALRDTETNQRLAEGLTIDELATESGAEARLLKTQIDRLSHRDTRLLETVTPADGSPTRYRLPHERLVPALYRLTGKLLAEVDQAKLKFQNAFQAWKTNDKRSHYLLKAKELRLIERYEAKIPWGNDEQEKKSFLRVSQRYRRFIRGGSLAAVIALIGIGWISYTKYQRYEGEGYLTYVDYPVELYDWQDQIKKLGLGPIDLALFNSLSSGSIEELSLYASFQSNKIDGLASLSKCSSLKTVALDLSSSQVSDLKPLEQLKGLTHLTLSLNSQVSDLKPLEQLKGLTHLTLSLGQSQVSDLKPLEQLKRLTHLTLDISFGQVIDLKPLEQLKRLTHLTLNFDISFGQVIDLKPLEQLAGLTQLTLRLPPGLATDLKPLEQLKGLTQLTLNSSVNNLKLLEQFKGLTQLTLNLNYSQVNDLRSLEQLEKLTHLTLFLSQNQVIDLKPLEQLKGLTQLTLYLNSSVDNLKPLEQLKGLTQMILNLRFSQATDLKPLEQLKGLTDLTLSLSQSHVTNLEPLEQLKGLTQLTLSLNSPAIDLKPLEQLMRLTQLTLNLGNEIGAVTQVSDLKLLEQLKGLAQLTLDLRQSQVSDLKPLEQLKGLTQLKLNHSYSQVSDLKPLEQLERLTHLTLDLRDSQVSDLKPLEQLKELKSLDLTLSGTNKEKNLEVLGQFPKLESLSLAGLSTEQRRSLRKIPASLRELKF